MDGFIQVKIHGLLKEILPEILRYVAELREKGLLYIATMDKMSELVKPILVK